MYYFKSNRDNYLFVYKGKLIDVKYDFKFLKCIFGLIIFVIYKNKKAASRGELWTLFFLNRDFRVLLLLRKFESD